MLIEVYNAEHKNLWNEFLENSKNGLFLFNRNYMEYHSDRFTDHSLLVFDHKHDLLAILPAHQKDNSLISHNGLTYGGFIVGSQMKTPLMLEIFDNVLHYVKAEGFTSFYYKSVPYIYHVSPADEDRYSLFLLQAQLAKRQVLSIVPALPRLPYQERRQRAIKKAQKNNLFIQQMEDFSCFWSLLSDVLIKFHQVKPVHAYEEIQNLRDKFPHQIKLYGCYHENDLIAGVVIYDYKRVARAQYIAANEIGRELGALDYLFDRLLIDFYPEKAFFDFGPSNENDGQWLNKGLIEQKEGFGGRAVVHDDFLINIKDYESETCMQALKIV